MCESINPRVKMRESTNSCVKVSIALIVNQLVQPP